MREKKEYGETPGHVVVLSPQGTVDIKGLGAACRWPTRELIPVTKEEVLKFSERDYLEPNIAVAKEFVKPVLRLVAKQNKGVVPISCEK